MLSRNVICYLVDKRTPALFHSLNSFRSSRTSCAPKQPYPLVGCENNFTNLLNNIVDKQVSLTPNCDVKKYLKDNAGYYRSTFATLMDIFQIDRKTARSIISKNQMLDDIPKKRLIHNYNKLKDAGVSNQVIQNNVLLLIEDSNSFDRKLENVKRIVNNVNHGICFLYCDIKSLDFYIEESSKRYPASHNQLEFFQEQLQVETWQVCQIISKYLNFVTYRPQDTLKKIKLLLDYHVPVYSLVQNNWPVYLAYARIKGRLESYSKTGLSLPVEPSIFICDTTNFKKFIAANSAKTKKHCKKSEIIDFLSEKSGYDKALIEGRLPKTVINSISSVEELTDKIDIFLKEGYEYHDIIWSCKVLALSKSRITKRLSILNNMNERLTNLDILLWSQERFLTHIGDVESLANKTK